MPGVYDGSLARDWRAGESRIVKILGLKDQDDQCETREVSGVEQADCEGSNLSMLVRLQGPEALAEVRICTVLRDVKISQVVMWAGYCRYCQHKLIKLRKY